MNKIMIPMQGKIDSMNISVSAAILVLKQKDKEVFEKIFSTIFL